MLVSTAKGQKHCSTLALEEPVRAKMPNVGSHKVRDGTSNRISEMIDSLPEDRKKKVLAIRRKIKANKYNINKRLDVATDRLIEDLVTKRMEENEAKGTTRHG